jgi:hypothetical protein
VNEDSEKQIQPIENKINEYREKWTIMIECLIKYYRTRFYGAFIHKMKTEEEMGGKNM